MDEGIKWDADQAIQIAIALSRLIRPTSVSGDYAARIERNEAYLRIIPAGVRTQSYVLDTSTPPWLSQVEAEQLMVLVERYRILAGELGATSRLGTALWFAEHGAHNFYVEIRLLHAVTGLEALLNTSGDQATKQFTTRLASLASELGFTMSKTQASKIYEARSEASHGMPAVLGPDQAKRDKSAERLDLIEAVLRAAVRRGLEDDDFRAALSSAGGVEDRWG